MIFITGDTHGTIDFIKLGSRHFAEGKMLTREDYVIILGDFGGVWRGNKKDDYLLNWYEKKPWTTLFIDGNHENHRALAEYPVQLWNSGKVSFIRPHVIYLRRGQVFTIGGKTFFTMGGAESYDKEFRTENVSWWPEEIPADEKLAEGLDNLARNDNRVDCILTHASPFGKNPEKLQCFFDELRRNVSFGAWYSGHLHKDGIMEGKYHLLFQNIERIGDRIENY